MSATDTAAVAAPLPDAPRRSAWLTLVLPWVLLSIVASLWALAMPPGGSPDEPAHAVKAASVVRGQFTPSSMIDKGGVLDVPAYIAFEYDQTCYAFFATQSAGCMPALQGDPDALVQSYSSASLYDPVYYVLVGWPSLIFHDEAGVYAMRIVSVVLCAFFVALAFWLIAGWRRRRLPAVGALVALTPMALFITASINPNALEFTGGLAVFTAMLSIVLSPSERLLRRRLAVVVVGSALVVHARSISPLWIAVLLLTPLILLSGRELIRLLRRRAVLVSAALIVIATALSLWWTVSSNSLGLVPTSGPDVAPPTKGVGTSFFAGFLQSIGDFYTQLRQMIGILGWLDTIFNPLVYFAFYAMIALLALGVIVWVRGRRLVFTIVVAAAFFLLPPFVQALYITRGGYIWQGRYTLILFMCLLVAAATAIASSPGFERFRHSRRLTTIVAWAFAAIWFATGVWAFATALRRNVVGYLASWRDMVSSPQWSPPLGAAALIALYTLAAGGFALWVMLSMREKAVLPARETVASRG
jgi:hypothetical protein